MRKPVGLPGPREKPAVRAFTTHGDGRSPVGSSRNWSNSRVDCEQLSLPRTQTLYVAPGKDEPSDAVVVEHAEGRAARLPADRVTTAARAAAVVDVRLDPEADVATPPHEAARARVDEPRPRQDAVEVLQELGEQRGRPRAAGAGVAEQRYPIAALRDREAADVVVVQHREVAGADAARGRVWRVGRDRRGRLSLRDAEADAAAATGAEGARRVVRHPRAGQPPVPVLEELAQEM